MSTLRAAFFALLVPLVAASSACGRSAEKVAGPWDTTLGGDTTVTLAGQGANITGTYTGKHSGSLSGTLSGAALSGRWKEAETPAKQGSFTFTFSDDGKTWKGIYKSDDGSIAGSWDGQKQAPASEKK